MRIALTTAAILLSTSACLATPVQAQQGGQYMWCTAWTDTGTDTAAAKTFYYSAFFAAGAWEADRKAFAFKTEVEKTSGAKVKSTCMPPADYDRAIATRNLAMKSAPGQILTWAG